MLLQVCWTNCKVWRIEGVEPLRVFAAKLLFRDSVKLHLTRIMSGIEEAPCAALPTLNYRDP
jgi:hypothetical protein